MEIIAMVFGVSIAWYLGKLFCGIFEEILVTRLHRNKYYNIIAGKCKKETKKKSGQIESVSGTRIGF